MNHVFTCVICSRQWDVVSDAKLDCFFSGACCSCIQEYKVGKDQIEAALKPLFKSHVDVTESPSNLFRDPLFSLSPESIEKKSNNGTRATTEQIQEVFGYWKVTCKHPNAVLDAKRAGAISRQLVRYGRSVEDLKRAVLGASLDPFLLTNKKEGAVYDDIELICRDAKHVERWIAMADRAEKDQRRLVDGSEGAESYGDIFDEIRRGRT